MKRIIALFPAACAISCWRPAAGSEAAETMYLIFGCENNREVVLVAASVKAVGGLDWMTRPTQLNCCKNRQTWRAKDAVRLQPKWYAAKLLVFSMRAHGSDGCRCSRQGLN